MHNDVPSTSTCSKKYPVVTKKGNTFLFLWFCPMHGHCYRCHIVHGSEGRKDLANSLCTHIPEAPEVVFYDFACSLEEYCMDREAGFFKNTRFHHDLFHEFSHNCSSVYSSKGLTNLQSVNTSICEQFNSYYVLCTIYDQYLEPKKETTVPKKARSGPYLVPSN